MVNTNLVTNFHIANSRNTLIRPFLLKTITSHSKFCHKLRSFRSMLSKARISNSLPKNYNITLNSLDSISWLTKTSNFGSSKSTLIHVSNSPPHFFRVSFHVSLIKLSDSHSISSSHHHATIPTHRSTWFQKLHYNSLTSNSYLMKKQMGNKWKHCIKNQTMELYCKT
jgi:hypothetical protein